MNRRYAVCIASAMALALGSAAFVACAGDRAEGLAPARKTGGPAVVWDLEAKPLAEIPLPNDFATRIDETSPTGRRLNVGTQAVTKFESKTRAKFNRLDGFGTYTPITVSFSRPLDVQSLRARHANDDFRDDAVFLLNVDKRCKRFGEEIAIDMGRGRFPIVLDKVGRQEEGPDSDGLGNVLFEFDPLRRSNNLLFEERDEDKNGNGILDPGEDTDFDGHLDKPNLDDPNACNGLAEGTPERNRCIVDHLLTFYDRESETLILRPVWPLEQRCTHAVVLTNRVLGEDGRAIESPFPSIAPRDQAPFLEPIRELLPRYGLSLDDVAFTWSFTTGTMTKDLEAVRAGLYGHGPFARLATEFPVESLEVAKLKSPKTVGGTLTPPACTAQGLTYYWYKGINEWQPNMCAMAADNAPIAGVAWGTYEVPYFVTDKDGNATPSYRGDDNELWDIDTQKGTGTYSREKVTYWCAIPFERDTSCSPGNPEGKPFCAPFPTIGYAHGYGSSRLEMVSFMARHAAMGMATCAIDVVGHGGNEYLRRFGDQAREFAKFGLDGLAEVLFAGRDRDLNNDGILDSGGDFWTADLFHTRDMLRQATVEWMQFIRILRSMDGQRRAADGRLLGDLNGDGKVDIGGPKNTVSMWGISLGGMVAGILAGAEPALDAISPNAGGAGLTDVAGRSKQAGVPEAAVLPITGPFVIGYPSPDDKGTPPSRFRLAFIANNVNKRERLEFADVRGLAPGDRVEIHNLDNGESGYAIVDERGYFRAAVAADALGPLERRPLLGLGDEPADPPVEFEDTPKLGDRLEVRIFDGRTGAPKALSDGFTGEEYPTIRSFVKAVAFQGTSYPIGAPLVALQSGLGIPRNSPRFRRFLGLAQMALDPADTAIWSQHYFEDPIDASYDPNAWPGRNHVLVVPTMGDMNVPQNTAIASARIAGILGSWRRDESVPAEYGWRKLFVPDPRYGKSIDQMLIDTYVIEGVERLERYPNNPKNRFALYDVDNLSDGRALFPCEEFDCDEPYKSRNDLHPVPHPEPGKELRATHRRADGSFDAMRIPYLRPDGQHGIYNAQATRAYDNDTYAVNFTSKFLGSRGRDVDHLGCMECMATAIPTWLRDGQNIESELVPLGPCGPQNVKLCPKECAEKLNLRTPEEPQACP